MHYLCSIYKTFDNLHNLMQEFDINLFKEKLQTDLYQYLLEKKEIDEQTLIAPELEEKWEAITKSYLPDGVSEYRKFPTVSLGWMMYIGMATAKFWNTDWEKYDAMDDLYAYMRKQRGFNQMDDYIREEVLELKGDDFNAMEKLVGECAARTHSFIQHQQLQPATREAFRAYLHSLQVLFNMGVAVEMRRSLKEI